MLCDQFAVIHVCGKGNLESSLDRTSGYWQVEYLHQEMTEPCGWQTWSSAELGQRAWPSEADRVVQFHDRLGRPGDRDERQIGVAEDLQQQRAGRLENKIVKICQRVYERCCCPV